MRPPTSHPFQRVVVDLLIIISVTLYPDNVIILLASTGNYFHVILTIKNQSDQIFLNELEILKVVRNQIVYSPSNDVKEAYRQIAKQLEQIDFEPNFLLLFLTEGTWKNYKIFTELFRMRFPDAKMLGCTVEGYLVKDEIWMRGLAALLGKFEGKVDVFWAKDKTASKTAQKLGEQIGKGWDAILLMFPAFYFPGKFRLLKTFIADRRYYREFRNAEKDSKMRILKKASLYLEKQNLLYPINKVLSTLARLTDRSTYILGMNLMPLQASTNTPLIIAGYKDVRPGAAAICFKSKVDIDYEDVFPERGRNYSETHTILQNYFTYIEPAKTIKGGAVIGEIEGLKPVDFLKIKRSGFQTPSEREFINTIERRGIQMASPYLLAFISKETYGSSFQALGTHPINLHPALFDLDGFYDDAVFLGEVFKGGIEAFSRILSPSGDDEFILYIIDQNTIMSYGGGVHNLFNKLYNSKNNFAVFSSFPSAFMPKTKRRYLTEISKGVCVSTSGTSALLKFK